MCNVTYNNTSTYTFLRNQNVFKSLIKILLFLSAQIAYPKYSIIYCNIYVGTNPTHLVRNKINVCGNNKSCSLRLRLYLSTSFCTQQIVKVSKINCNQASHSPTIENNEGICCTNYYYYMNN